MNSLINIATSVATAGDPPSRQIGLTDYWYRLMFIRS